MSLYTFKEHLLNEAKTNFQKKIKKLHSDSEMQRNQIKKQLQDQISENIKTKMRLDFLEHKVVQDETSL